MTQNVDLLFKVKVLDEASGKLQKVLNSFRKLDTASKKQITANLKGIRESSSEIRERIANRQQVPAGLAKGISRRGGAIEGALEGRGNAQIRKFRRVFGEFETATGGRTEDTSAQGSLNKQQAAGELRVLQNQKNAVESLQRQRSSAFVAEQGRNAAEAKRISRLKQNIQLTQQQIKIEGQTEQSLRRLASQHRALAQATGRSTVANQLSTQKLLQQTAALNAQANAQKTFGFGVIQRSKKAAQSFAVLSSGAAGFMLASSVLDGNLTNVAFSLIFLQFAMAPIVVAVALATAGFGLLARKLGEMKKVTNTIRALSLQMTLAGTTALITSGAILKAREIVNDFGFGVEDATKAIGLLTASQLDLGNNLDTIARIASATGRPIAEVTRSLIDLIKPTEFSIGSFTDFRKAIAALIPITARNADANDDGRVSAEELIAADAELFAKIAGLTDGNERLRRILNLTRVEWLELSDVQKVLIKEDGKLSDAGEELLKSFDTGKLEQFTKAVLDVAKAAGIDATKAAELLTEALQKLADGQDAQKVLNEIDITLGEMGLSAGQLIDAIDLTRRALDTFGVSISQVAGETVFKADISQIEDAVTTLTNLDPFFEAEGQTGFFAIIADLKIAEAAEDKDLVNFMIKELQSGGKTIEEQVDIVTKLLDSPDAKILEAIIGDPNILINIAAEADASVGETTAELLSLLGLFKRIDEAADAKKKKESEERERLRRLQEFQPAFEGAPTFGSAPSAVADPVKPTDVLELFLGKSTADTVKAAAVAALKAEQDEANRKKLLAISGGNVIPPDTIIDKAFDDVVDAVANKPDEVVTVVVPPPPPQRSDELFRESLLDDFGLAKGGIVRRPTIALLGEDGPEAVIPLGRGRLGSSIVININGNLIGNDEFLDLLADKIMRSVGVDATGRF